MKKKLIGLVLLAAVYSAVATGCGTLPHHPAPPKPPGAPAAP